MKAFYLWARLMGMYEMGAEAKVDLEKVLELEQSMWKALQSELKLLESQMKGRG